MLLFVYGTLKKAYWNHIIIQDAEYIGDYIFNSPNHYMVDLGPYPAVMLGKSGTIHGEVYRINDEQFKRCDHLEGYPNFYTRSIIDTTYGKAWMYHFHKEDSNDKYNIISEWKRLAR